MQNITDEEFEALLNGRNTLYDEIQKLREENEVLIDKLDRIKSSLERFKELGNDTLNHDSIFDLIDFVGDVSIVIGIGEE